MRVSSHTVPRPYPLAATSPTPQPAEAAAEPQDGFSLKKTAAEGVLFFMGRRIPTAVPDVSKEKAAEITGKLQGGDVILTADCAYPGWARMEYWTVRSSYTHAAYYGGDGKVYEATGGGVKAAELEGYFEGRLKVAVIRPPYQSPEDVQAATTYCQAQVGKAYDSVFDTGDDSEFYCSELVYKALKATPHPIDTPATELMGKPFVGPDALQEIPGSTMIHDDRSNYWTNKAGHWPLALSAVGGAAAGAALYGTAGAVAGFSVGLLGSILIGNKIQVGEFLPSLNDVASKKHPQEPEQSA